ncbi:hypothetical protein GN956_G25106 [Arapaima gigas]
MGVNSETVRLQRVFQPQNRFVFKLQVLKAKSSSQTPATKGEGRCRGEMRCAHLHTPWRRCSGHILNAMWSPAVHSMHF